MKKFLASDLFLLFSLCFILYFPFLGFNVLWDFDEGYFASIAKEMYEKGEWIVPTYNGNELGDKPILIFWGMLVSFSIFGVSEFSVRFPSILYGTGTVFLTYFMARRLFGSRTLALRSAVVLATMILFVVETRGTTCDGAMIFWLTAALVVYVYGCFGFQEGYNEQNSDTLTQRLAPWFPNNWITVVLMNACLGMSALAKGPAPPLFVSVVIGTFLLFKAYPGKINRNPLTWITAFLRICWLMKPLTAAATVLLVAGPWFFAVGYLTDWEWTKMFFIEHNFERTVAPTRGHTGFGLSILYYPVTSLFGVFPWSLFLIPVCLDTVRNFRRVSERRNSYLFIFCWIAFYFLFFTIVSTKLAHYVVPAYPGIAMLVGVYLFHWRHDNEMVESYWTPVVLIVSIIIGIGMIVTFHIILPNYIPREQWVGRVLGLIPMSMGVVGLIVYRKKNRRELEKVYYIHVILFTAFLFQWAAAELTEHASHRNDFLHHIEAGTDASGNPVPPTVLCEIKHGPSWVFYSDQLLRRIPLTQLKEWSEERNDANALVERIREELIEQDRDRPRFFTDNNERRFAEGPLYIITSDKDYDEFFKPFFGDALKVIDRERYFMKKFDKILLLWQPDEGHL